MSLPGQVTKLVLGITLALSLLPACSKSGSSAGKDAAPQLAELGAVDLTYGTPSRHDLGGGNVCIITAQPMGPGTMEIVAELEKSGKKVSSTRALPVTVNQPLELSFGTVKVKLVPRAK